jgi:NAD(P)H dehydrogenase (quinone)
VAVDPREPRVGDRGVAATGEEAARLSMTSGLPAARRGSRIRERQEQCRRSNAYPFMRYLVLYAHPDPRSYAAALHRCVVETLEERGHEVDDCDLYAERFEPVLSLEERRKYNDESASHPEVEDYVRRLKEARGIVFVYPSWFYGMPAILKGYLDRVWLPGIAFRMVDGKPASLLHHVERFGVVTTYGAPRSINEVLVGDPNKRALMRGLGRLAAKTARKLWLAQYAMDSIGDEARARFLTLVKTKVRDFS